jgi:hypothetical protein
MKPNTHSILKLNLLSLIPKIDDNHLNTFTPVGTAIIIVAAEK